MKKKKKKDPVFAFNFCFQLVHLMGVLSQTDVEDNYITK